MILGCRAIPLADCTVALLETEELEFHPARELDCRVVAIDDMTHDIRRLRLEILSGGPFAFSAGQFASLRFPGLPARDYSMANRPDEALLEFHIRLVAGGAVTPHLRERLKVGDTLRVSGPMGTSSWRRRHTGPILAVAGGSGLAPIKSIVETALTSGARQPIRLYVGGRAERERRLAAAPPRRDRAALQTFPKAVFADRSRRPCRAPSLGSVLLPRPTTRADHVDDVLHVTSAQAR